MYIAGKGSLQLSFFMQKPEDKKYSIEEYFSLVEELDYKIEYHKGRIVAMAGGTSNHNIIATNILTQLNLALRDKDCVTYNSDMALSIEKENRYVYPDAMVICGQQEFEDKKELRVKNPILIVEVLSDSTKGFDKRKKFTFYRTIPSFREYLLIHSDAVFAEAFYREDSKHWHISSAYHKESSLYLHSLDLSINLGTLYSKTRDIREWDAT